MGKLSGTLFQSARGPPRPMAERTSLPDEKRSVHPQTLLPQQRPRHGVRLQDHFQGVEIRFAAVVPGTERIQSCPQFPAHSWSAQDSSIVLRTRRRCPRIAGRRWRREPVVGWRIADHGHRTGGPRVDQYVECLIGVVEALAIGMDEKIDVAGRQPRQSRIVPRFVGKVIDVQICRGTERTLLQPATNNSTGCRRAISAIAGNTRCGMPPRDGCRRKSRPASSRRAWVRRAAFRPAPAATRRAGSR